MTFVVIGALMVNALQKIPGSVESSSVEGEENMLPEVTKLFPIC